MNAPLQIAGSLRTRSRLSQWGVLLLMGGLGVIAFLQTRMLMRTTGGGETSTNLILQAMQARVNGVSLGILSYLQNHDPESLARIKSEGKEASRLLGDYKADAAQNEGQEAYGRIEKAHDDVREATLALLAADHSVVTQRNALKESADALLSLLTDQMETSIKASQLNASGRFRAVRTAIAEAKEFTHDSSGVGFSSTSQARFRRSIGTYEDLSRTRRTSRWSEDARGLFDQCTTRSRDLQQALEQKQSAQERYTQQRNAFDKAIQQAPQGHGTGFRIRSLAQLFASGVAFAVMAGILLLVGVALVMWTNHRTETQLVTPIQDILQCVEAASTGDVSRLPSHWSRDEVGQLSQAVGRLITVLARSENLVYHLAALVESSGEAIISHSLDGSILSWNKGAQRIYGYSAEEVKGQSITLLSPNDGGAEMMRNLMLLRNGERIQPFETIHQASNGRTIRALVRVSAILDSTRKVIGASFCAQDLTETGLLRPRSLDTKEVA